MTNSSLTKLMLSGGVINESMPLIAEAVKHNKTLLSLNLDSNFAKDISIECLTEMIKENNTLKSLSLQDNHFHEEGIKCLYDAAKHYNQSLFQLNLHNNFGSHKTLEKIDKALTRKAQFELGFFNRNKQTAIQPMERNNTKELSLLYSKPT